MAEKLLRFKDIFKEGHPLARPLSFSYMHETDYRPGEDELTQYRAYRRKRVQGAGSGEGGPISEDIDESLTMQQRIKRGRIFKRFKAKIKRGQERAKRRMANRTTLERRALKQAKTLVLKKITKGIPKNELTFARRQEIEKKMEKPAVQKRIKMLARKLIKDVRKKEIERKKG